MKQFYLNKLKKRIKKGNHMVKVPLGNLAIWFPFFKKINFSQNFVKMKCYFHNICMLASCVGSVECCHYECAGSSPIKGDLCLL